MGTNYYARIIPTKKRREELAELIGSSNDFNKIKDEIDKTFGTISYDDEVETYTGGVVHIGKRSGGWKFLWNPNQYKIYRGHIEHYKDNGIEKTKYVEDPYEVFKLYDLTKESIKKFIDREDVLIYDEYGELQEDKEEFFNMAVNWVTWKTPDGEETEAWDGVLYAKWQKENGEHYRKYTKTEYCTFLEELGYTMTEEYTDFFSDGLRFATNTCFS